MSDPSQEMYRNVVLGFWKELAVLEAEIAAALRLDGKEPPAEKLVRVAAPTLLPVFFDIMTHIDPNDKAVEDPDAQTSAMHATLAIQAFFIAIAPDVFNNFLAATFERSIKSDDWTLRHSAILLLSCMCPLDIEMPVQGPEDICRVLAAQIPHLLAGCVAHDNPRLMETSLYVLGMVLLHYPPVISQRDLCPDPAMAVRQIVELFVINDSTHPLIISRYCLIIANLVRIWKVDSLYFRSPLPDFFPRFVSLLRRIMGRCQGSEADMDLYIEAADTLSHVITGIIEPARTFAELRLLFNQTLNDLEATRRGLNTDAVRFTMQVHLCANLSSLAFTLQRQIHEADVHRAVALLLELLLQPHELLYEEALITIARLYTALFPVFERDDVMSILKVIQFALESESPGVINAASVLLGCLFKISGPALAEHFTRFWEIEEQLLHTHYTTRDIHPPIIKTLADMLEGLSASDEHRPMLELFGDRVWAIMRMIRSSSIDLTKEADLVYANMLFACLAPLYRMYAQLYYPVVGHNQKPEEFIAEKNALNEMTNFAAVIARLGQGVVHEMVLKEFILMAPAFGEKCSRKNNITLNKPHVHMVLGMTQEGRFRPSLMKSGNETMSFLRGR
jgi:hypothetical protein